MRRLALTLVAALALAGCGGGSDDASPAPQPAPKPPSSAARGEAVIRDWTKAVYDGDYEHAAALFAPHAIVQQGASIVLKTRADAIAFNRSLPCRAKVTAIAREPHGVLRASFDLLPGRAGACHDGGTARVRFFIRGGKIETWHQLPEQPQAPGQTT